MNQLVFIIVPLANDDKDNTTRTTIKTPFFVKFIILS